MPLPPKLSIPVASRAIVLAAMLGLNFAPVNGAVGVGLALLSAFAAPFDAGAFCIYVAASQVTADALGLPLTLAQLGFAGWCLTLPWNGWLRGTRGAARFLVVVGPLLAWTVSVLAINGTFALLGYDLLLAVLFGAIAAGYGSSGRVAPSTLVVCLLIGMGFAAIGFWGLRLDLPVISNVLDASPSRPVERIGSGRGDANVVGLNLPVALAGLVVWAIAAVAHNAGRRKVAYITMLGALLAFLPPIVATASRTSIYSVVGGAAAVVAVLVRAWVPAARGTRRKVVGVAVAAALGISILAVQFGQEAAEYLNATLQANEEQARDFGASALFAGRANAWGTHLDILREYPLAGIPEGTSWDFGEYGTAVIGRSGIYGAAHNTFLEFGSLTGLPGVLLFIVTLVRAAMRVLGARSHLRTEACVVAFFVMMLGLSGLSVPGWKTLWTLVGVMTIWPHRAAEPGGRIREGCGPALEERHAPA